MSIGLLYDGDGMLLEGDGPRTFTAMQDVTMAFRAIVQAAPGDPGGELRLGDQLWVIPPDLDPDGIGGRLVHDALLLVLRETEGQS